MLLAEVPAVFLSAFKMVYEQVLTGETMVTVFTVNSYSFLLCPSL